MKPRSENTIDQAEIERYLREYKRVYMPEKDDLADLLTKAKGDRSMADFARICEENPATFSRIVQRKIIKPLDLRIVHVIVKNAAPASGVTLEAVMRANGYMPIDDLAMQRQRQEEQKGRDDKEPALSRSGMFAARMALNKQMRAVILESLYEKFTITIYQEANGPREDMIPPSRHCLSRHSQLIVGLTGKDFRYWNFLFNVDSMEGCSLKKSAGQTSADRKKEEFYRNCVYKYANLFLRDSWEPDTMAEFKNTIVFAEETAYKLFLNDVMGDVRVNSRISVMLVDVDKRVIVEEVELKRNK
ncbi:MAG: hypothetical protein K6E75_11165 [Lachnospiraceae bacterium]|nr:hypothetical protein [Lachnospiraceae bacterium]